MQTKFIAITKPEIEIDGQVLSPEAFMIWCARVSSAYQDNPNYVGLLKTCLREGHWSVFESVSMTIEIITTRAIAAQILRHRSFRFLEFSLRYAKALGYEAYEARRQDTKNRQNSFDDLDKDTKEWFLDAQQAVWSIAHSKYETALELGIAKECARSVLPLNTVTRLYMTGEVRNWINYLKVRCHPATQAEHRAIADSIKGIFIEQFPTISAALDWSNS